LQGNFKEDPFLIHTLSILFFFWKITEKKNLFRIDPQNLNLRGECSVEEFFSQQSIKLNFKETRRFFIQFKKKFQIIVSFVPRILPSLFLILCLEISRVRKNYSSFLHRKDQNQKKAMNNLMNLLFETSSENTVFQIFFKKKKCFIQGFF